MDKLYTVRDLAEILKLSVVGVRKMALREGYGRKIGKRRYFTETEIKSILKGDQHEDSP